MTVMFGTTEISDVRLGTAQVDRLMLGTTEVWSAAPPMSPSWVTCPFDNQAMLEDWYPTRGFDRRSYGTNPGWVFNEMLVAGDNAAVTHWNLIAQRQYNSVGSEWSIQIGDTINTVARPTSLIFGADKAMTHMFMLDIGSDGMRFRVVTPTSNGTTQTFGGPVATFNTIKVVRRSDGTYGVYKNNTYLTAWTPGVGTDKTMLDGYGYAGVGVYSSSGQWSARVTDSNFAGEGWD